MLINVLVYNIMQTLPEPIRFYGTKERAVNVIKVVEDIDLQHRLDVVIFNEVITLHAQEVIENDMRDMGFVYSSDKLQNTFMITGGTKIYSRYPILECKTSPFGDNCSGVDCFAAKGVVYVRIDKGMIFNIFGTHFQAWPSLKEQHVRENQVLQLSQFINALNIPETEPVLVGGDFNMDMYLGKPALQHLMYLTSTELPNISEDSHLFTVDPLTNQMVGNDDPIRYTSVEWPHACETEYYDTLICPCCPSEWIDYILYSRKHLKPLKSEMKVIKAKVPPFKAHINRTKIIDMTDVSDHFPLLGTFEFFNVKSDKQLKIDHEKLEKISDSTSHTTYICFLIIAIILIVLFLVYFLIWRATQKSNHYFDSEL